MQDKKQSLVPELRFPGFEGEWEMKKFGELCKTITPSLKLQSSNYLKAGKYPIVDQSQSLICGWTNDSKGLISNVPVIIFGDHTCVLKYIDFPFIQGADGVKILSPQSGYDSRFIYQSFLANPVIQDGYKRHFSEFKEKTYMFPSLPEQQKIAECLSSVDNLIQAEADQLQALKDHKKGLMQQLFPQEGEITPKLRFPGFEGEWEEKKFKDFTFSAGKKNKQNLPYERYSISNETGFCPQNDQFEGGGGYLKDIDCRMYIIVSPMSFAYNPARINVGSIGYQNLGKDVIVSSLYEVFQTTDICDDTFLWQWFKSNAFRKMVVDVQEGGVRQYFYYNKLQECSIHLPSLPEQQKIAECLSSLDEGIAAQQEKVEALKEHKKGLMQKLFSTIN